MRGRFLRIFANGAVILWVLVSGLALCASGCQSVEDDLANNSERPWNSPRGYDSRLPAQLMEGR